MSFKVTFSPSPAFKVEFDHTVEIPMGDFYTGDYVVTPSSEAQTLHTTDLLMTDNVTINPIPQNYGLIIWNGSTLTVS